MVTRAGDLRKLEIVVDVRLVPSKSNQMDIPASLAAVLVLLAATRPAQP
jgi:hypothetical protein